MCRYFDKRDAEDAMEALNGRQYDGRDLRITIDPGRPSRYSACHRDENYSNFHLIKIKPLKLLLITKPTSVNTFSYLQKVIFSQFQF